MAVAGTFKRQQDAEEETEHDQAKEDHVRSFILPLSASTETFERLDINDCFHHSPDEKARHQDTEIERILSEKRLHVLHPLRVILLCTAWQIDTVLLSYAIILGLGKQSHRRIARSI